MARSRSPYLRRFPLRGALGLGAGIAVTALGLSLASPAETSAESRRENFAGRSNDPAVVRSRDVSVDVDQVAGLEPNQRITFTLFDDVSFTGVVEATDPNGSRLGRIEGAAPGTFTLAVAGDGLAAIIQVPGVGTYRIRSDGDGAAVAEEIDQDALPPCANGPEQHVIGGPAAEGGIASDDGSVIDLLVVYTPLARNGAGGTSALQSIINAAVANANNSYNRSGIGMQLNLVHTAEVNYDESGSYSDHLYRLTNAFDGYFDDAHDLRDQYNADMVSLIVADNQYCGLAWLMQNLSPAFSSSAFSVTSWFCAAGNLTLAHELGHNMGCAHDRDNANNGLFSYSFGYQDTFEVFRTVMAYNCPTGCSRIQNFSNPDVLYAGRPTGVDIGEPDSAHNTQTINLSAYTIANFRQSVPPDCNGNGVPDPVDIAEGTSQDCNFNGVPDSCDFEEQTSADCNGNGTPDECDIDDQTSADVNGNGVPDECDCLGDTNDNGEVGVEDFLQMLADWGPCGSCPADLDSDGNVGVSDFLSLLARWGPCP